MFDAWFGLPVDKTDVPEDELADEPDSEPDDKPDEPDAEPDAEPDTDSADEPAGAEPEEGDISACRMLQPAAMVMMVSKLISVKRVLFFIFFPPYWMCLRLSCIFCADRGPVFLFHPSSRRKTDRVSISAKKNSEKNEFDLRMRYNENNHHTVKPPRWFCGDKIKERT